MQQRVFIHAYLAKKWDIMDEVDSDGDGANDNTDGNPTDSEQQ